MGAVIRIEFTFDVRTETGTEQTLKTVSNNIMCNHYVSDLLIYLS